MSAEGEEHLPYSVSSRIKCSSPNLLVITHPALIFICVYVPIALLPEKKGELHN